MYEEMIVTGAWWDCTDAIAPHRIGDYLLRGYPESMTPVMIQWSRSTDRWKRRSAIICQLGFKEATDLGLLYACIEPNLDDRDFFIRKAIGWALRDYAWTDPDEVSRYVREYDSRLSALSRREALKNIERPRQTKPSTASQSGEPLADSLAKRKSCAPLPRVGGACRVTRPGVIALCQRGGTAGQVGRQVIDQLLRAGVDAIPGEQARAAEVTGFVAMRGIVGKPRFH